MKKNIKRRDVKDYSSRSNYLSKFVIVIILILLSVFTFIRLKGDNNLDNINIVSKTESKNELKSTDKQSPFYNKKSTSIRIYLDGWSYNLLNNKTLTLSDESESIKGENEFKPLPSKEITNDMKDNFEIYPYILARIYPIKDKLNCSGEKCEDSKGEINILSSLSNPAQINGFEKFYGDEKINSGVYYADFTIPENLSFMVLTSNDAKITLTREVAINFNELESNSPPLPENGFNKGIYPLAFSFSHLFFIDPYWINNKGSYQGTLGFTGEDSKVKFSKPPFLTLRSRDLNVLSYSELTYLSSPSVGCGSITVCTTSPNLDINFKLISSNEYNLCTADKKRVKVSQIYGETSIKNSKTIYLGGLNNEKPLSGDITYLQNIFLLNGGEGIISTASEREIGKLNTWGKKELENFYFGIFKYCK